MSCWHYQNSSRCQILPAANSFLPASGAALTAVGSATNMI
jgi:hypothetical protein